MADQQVAVDAAGAPRAASDLSLPGLDLAMAGRPHESVVRVGRADVNAWWLLVAQAGAAGWPSTAADGRGGDLGHPSDESHDATEELLDRLARCVARCLHRRPGDDVGGRFSPAALLAEAGRLSGIVPPAGDGTRGDRRGSDPPASPFRVSAVAARIELDTCGAWVTVANAGPMRPVVVRRAGWIDVRGQAGPPLGGAGRAPSDDRTGLGPGDALVVTTASRAVHADAGGQPLAAEVLPELLLDAVGRAPLDVARRLARAGVPAVSPADRPEILADAPDDDGLGPVVVVKVPLDLGPDPWRRVADAVGVPVDHVVLPGYPQGDLQPDLWSPPPLPPREARLHLLPDVLKLAEVRALLRRLLASWRLAERVDALDIELLATEVLTNVIRHVGTPAVVIVRYTGPTLRIEVGDGSPARPVVLPRDADRDGGRGLFLVDALASSWGVTTTRRGKRVWFEVPVSDAIEPKADGS